MGEGRSCPDRRDQGQAGTPVSGRGGSESRVPQNGWGAPVWALGAFHFGPPMLKPCAHLARRRAAHTPPWRRKSPASGCRGSAPSEASTAHEEGGIPVA